MSGNFPPASKTRGSTPRSGRTLARRAEISRIGWLNVLAGIVAVSGAIPLIALAVLASGDSGDAWPHLAANVLPSATATTLKLTIGVGVLSSIIGVTTAWIVARYRFPGVRLLEWGLVLPLAIPTYIAAYCYVELLDFSGPLQSSLRALAGREVARAAIPDIRNLPGAIFLMSAVLYPYVYLSCRLVFALQGVAMIETARMLGAGGIRLFWRVALPLARPAIAGGAALAMLETLNDIGAVEMLGVRTLTFSVFDTWLNRSSLAGAAQLAWIVLIPVAILVMLERHWRGQRHYSAKGHVQPSRQVLQGWRAVIAILVCTLPVLAGFVAPAAIMVSRAMRRPEQWLDPALLAGAFNSLFAAGLAAMMTAVLALTAAAAARRNVHPALRTLFRIPSLGYAMPGVILAIGSLYAFSWFDTRIDGISRGYFGHSTGLLVTGTVAIILFAYCLRFFAVALNAIESGYSRMQPQIVPSARALGHGEAGAFLRVELPLMSKPLAVAALFVFVDAIKELPATLLLRPFGFSTLSTFVYEKASRGLFDDAAAASLTIAIVGGIAAVAMIVPDRQAKK